LVTTVRVFSISAGLDASTVTPGRIASDASLAVPTIDAVAYANNTRGMARRDTRTTIAFTHLGIVTSEVTTRLSLFSSAERAAHYTDLEWRSRRQISILFCVGDARFTAMESSLRIA
jgi:hypothetical protein